MTTFTEQKLKQEIEKTEKLIISRASEFEGEIGDFQWLINRGIAKELHAMTNPEYECIKPTMLHPKNQTKLSHNLR